MTPLSCSDSDTHDGLPWLPHPPLAWLLSYFVAPTSCMILSARASECYKPELWGSVSTYRLSLLGLSMSVCDTTSQPFARAHKYDHHDSTPDSPFLPWLISVPGALGLGHLLSRNVWLQICHCSDKEVLSRGGVLRDQPLSSSSPRHSSAHHLLLCLHDTLQLSCLLNCHRFVLPPPHPIHPHWSISPPAEQELGLGHILCCF